MDSEDCPFSSLPQHFCDNFLRQAFKQLDQRHLCGIVPLVCRPWHTLAVSCSSSLDVKVQTAAAGESLTSWVQKNGSNLQHFNVSLKGNTFRSSAGTATVKGLLQSAINTAARQLQSFQFRGSKAPCIYDIQLGSLTRVTSLTLSSCMLGACTTSSLQALTQLKSLDISRTTDHLDITDNLLTIEISLEWFLKWFLDLAAH